MRLDDDFEENNGGLPIIYMALGVSFFILLVLCVVISVNKDKRPSHKMDTDVYAVLTDAVKPQESGAIIEADVTKRVASDLDIWNLYPDKDKDDDDKIPFTFNFY